MRAVISKENSDTGLKNGPERGIEARIHSGTPGDQTDAGDRGKGMVLDSHGRLLSASAIVGSVIENESAPVSGAHALRKGDGQSARGQTPLFNDPVAARIIEEVTNVVRTIMMGRLCIDG